MSMPLHFCVEQGVLAIKPVLSTSRLPHGPPCHLAEPTEQASETPEVTIQIISALFPCSS